MWINRFETEPYGKRGMYFFEPLKTKAPRAGVLPYCCYIRTVIFYAYPFYCLPGKQSYVEYDRVETEWHLLGQRFMEGEGWGCLAPLVLHEGQIYELAPGQVIRHKGQWMMKHSAWRVPADDPRMPFILQSMAGMNE